MKSKKTKSAAKKTTAKKQPAKKVAPAKKSAPKVKVLTFEPDEVLQLKEHITALKDVIKMQKESANKLRKKNKALSEQVAELKKKIANKGDSILGDVTVTKVFPNAVAPTGPSSPFTCPQPKEEEKPVDVSPKVEVDWTRPITQTPAISLPKVSQSGLLGNACAVRY